MSEQTINIKVHFSDGSFIEFDRNRALDEFTHMMKKEGFLGFKADEAAIFINPNSVTHMHVRDVTGD
jgi:hypothetical protein